MPWTRTSSRRCREPEPPPLGNGREDGLSEEELARRARRDAPESQGAFADEDYGLVEQGAYGDENFDPGYQRATNPAAVDPDDALSSDSEHEGPGRRRGRLGPRGAARAAGRACAQGRRGRGRGAAP